LSKKVTTLAAITECGKVWSRATNVCSAINRLEERGIFLPEPIVPLVRHFATCDNCKSELAFMHKRCLAVLQNCEHGDGFLSAKGCVHITEVAGEGREE
jgi:hypothetical protein